MDETLAADEQGKISEENQKKAEEMCGQVDKWYEDAQKALPYFNYDKKDETSRALQGLCNTYVTVRTAEGAKDEKKAGAEDKD